MNLIVAVDNKWGIGKDGHLLCSIPGDMKFFKEKTSGKVVVMGRSTLESFPNRKPLPNRTNIVLTRKSDLDISGVTIVNSMEDLFDEINNYVPDDVYIIGGKSVYNELMEHCDKLYVTKIYHDLGADTFINNIDEIKKFKVVSSSDLITENGITYQFFEYRRMRV